MFDGIKVNKNGRNRFNENLLQLFGYFDMHSFVRISHLNWSYDAKVKEKYVKFFLTIIHKEVD